MAIRVSTIGQQQLVLSGLFENQRDVLENQRQITTGRKASDFRGLGGDTSTIVDSKAVLARTQSYQSTIDTVRGRLNVNDVQTQAQFDALEALQDGIRDALSNNQAQGFRELLDQTYEFVANSLNTNFDGVFTFAGINSAVPPVNALTLPDLAALGPPGSEGLAFDNADVAFSASVADGVTVDFGLLADQFSLSSFQSMRRLHDFDLTNPDGPLSGELTTAQFSFLQAELQNLDAAIDDVLQAQSSNGLVFGRVETIDQQQADTATFLQVFIGELEDVDLATAVTELNQNQVALQASFQSVATLNDLTLLNFI